MKLIDILRARLDAKNDRYEAELPSLALRDIRIEDQKVRDNERDYFPSAFVWTRARKFGAIADCSRTLREIH